MIKTSKPKKKDRVGVRVSVDDLRRYREILNSILAIAVEFGPYAVGVESYTVGPRAASSGWKTAVVYGGVIFWAQMSDLYLAAYRPDDLKRRFCRRAGASKLDVQEALYGLVEGFEGSIQAIPKTQREHLADATGHALLVLEEVDEARRMFGLR